jgi:hypothetical protein
MVTSEIAWHFSVFTAMGPVAGVSDRRPSATSASRKSRALREGSASALASRGGAHRHVFGMFVITEADAAAIRAVFNQEGELSAAIELRRRFPGVTDNAKARACARSIASSRSALGQRLSALRVGLAGLYRGLSAWLGAHSA